MPIHRFELIAGSYSKRFVLLFLLPLMGLGQPPIRINENFVQFSLKNQLSYSPDSTGKASFWYIQKHFKDIPIHDTYPNFGDSPWAHWLRFQLYNETNHPKKVMLITKGIDSLQTYLTIGDSLVRAFAPNGNHVPIFQRDKISPLVVETLVLSPQQTYTVWVRIRNAHYRLAASPLILYSDTEGAKAIFNKHFLYSVYIGSMFLILLIGLGLVYFFRERIYWYYLGCVSCALSIMLIYNDFSYLLFSKLPDFILNKNSLGVLSATVPVFYLLFGEQFLEIQRLSYRKVFVISRVLIFFQYLLIAILLAMGKVLFDYKLLFYPMMGGFSSITLYYLFNELHKPQAKFFLLATVPVTITVVLESFSQLHQIPVQNIHDYYYLTTVAELLILTFGIVRRFKKIEQDKLQLTQQKLSLENELLHIESNAKKEISGRIAEKLHNDASADIVVSRNKLALLQKKCGMNTHPEDWNFVSERLNDVYYLLRDLSHQLEKTATTQSLVSLLMSRYQGDSTVEIFYQELHPDIVLDSRAELVLFSVLSEIITNSLKHAQCTKIEVQIAYERPTITIIVEDNGIGFHQDPTIAGGMGLTNIKRQIEHTLKGSIVFDSNKNGTTVIIKAPLGQ